MPIYEYACKECGHRFEKMQPITSEPLKECPHCGKSAIHRVFQPVGVIFKGSGWYITDSRNNSKNSDDKGSDDKGSSDKGSGDKGSDKAAPAEKSEAKSETSSSGESSPGTAAPVKSTD
jgi:putative FmdB family regulatory protein